MVKIVVGAMLLASAAGLVWRFRGPDRPTAPQVEPPGSVTEANAPASSPGQPSDNVFVEDPQPQARLETTSPARKPAQIVPAPQLAAPPVPVDPAMRALVEGLSGPGGTNVALTPETEGVWRTNFMNLVQNGSAAIPALRAFLDRKVDYPFSQEVAQTLGYSSARLAAIDALRQIGGAEATAVMEGLLGTTQSPREIAVLARDLEEASPGQYREQALAAARAGLEAAAAARDPQTDVAPLFEVFQHYGDASAIPDLEKAMGSWQYYATIALANLPDNEGVPALLRLADPASGSGSRVVALEMVAQLAVSNPEARQFLAAQVANRSIPSNLWPYLTGPLAGDQFYPVDSAITSYPELQSISDLKTTHLANGNQSFYTLPGNQSLTTEGIQQRVALIDELLQSASDPTAIQVLQRARDTLAQRFARVSTPPPAGSPQ